jgi:hypothetical protein
MSGERKTLKIDLGCMVPWTLAKKVDSRCSLSLPLSLSPYLFLPPSLPPMGLLLEVPEHWEVEGAFGARRQS